MRILIVRHGEPDYSIDSLTEKGWREAEYLSERLCQEKIDTFYVSPLGRAKDTASFTLKKYPAEAVQLEWLKEFPPRITRPDHADSCAWDWLPQDWTVREKFYDKDRWYEEEEMRKAGVKEEYEKVCAGLDRLLAEHGYTRNGNYYHTEKGNHDTICLFCHFGVEMVMLSHLLGISCMPLWHGFCASPSSVTTVYTEEKVKGNVSFRVQSFGDISHLYVHGERPSFAARFDEVYGDNHETTWSGK